MTIIKELINIRLPNGDLEQYNSSVSGDGVEVFSYGFQLASGELFQCVETSLEACQAKRDAWLKLKAA
ncbi:MAG: DUF3873 domain-containing protein [Deltaproteobacteria bacterium]|jgi:hypothetical protein|nr:DUF3873 domain-containing protein [Deltaproteobacteria bacterium]